MENRNAFFLVGLVLIAAGFLLTPLLCGVGVLFLIIGGIMWARSD